MVARVVLSDALEVESIGDIVLIIQQTIPTLGSLPIQENVRVAEVP